MLASRYRRRVFDLLGCHAFGNSAAGFIAKGRKVHCKHKGCKRQDARYKQHESMLMITISALICVVHALNQNAWTFLYSLSAEMSQCQSGFPIGLSHSSYSILCKARFKNFVFLSGLSVDTYSIDSQIGIYFCHLLPLGSHERVCDGS